MSVPHQPAARELPRYCLGPKARVAISVALLLHLLAVLGEPLRMFTQGRQPAAPDAGVIRRTLGPYIDFAYLHHGYFFFAPNPGPSHLIDIRLIDADGSERHLRLPNHRAQWPRLLYHRHFMLSEFLFQLYAPPISPQAVAEGAQVPDDWRRDRALFEHVRSSMEKHLAVRYGAERAEIQLMEHRLPSAVEVFEEHVKLDDEKLYILLPDEVPLAGPTMPAPAGSAVGPSSAANRIPPVSQPAAPTPVLPHQTSEEVKP